jgi:hypothetical protein
MRVIPLMFNFLTTTFFARRQAYPCLHCMNHGSCQFNPLAHLPTPIVSVSPHPRLKSCQMFAVVFKLSWLMPISHSMVVTSSVSFIAVTSPLSDARFIVSCSIWWYWLRAVPPLLRRYRG